TNEEECPQVDLVVASDLVRDRPTLAVYLDERELGVGTHDFRTQEAGAVAQAVSRDAGSAARAYVGQLAHGPSLPIRTVERPAGTRRPPAPGLQPGRADGGRHA